jgi:1-acyl-sn-glycerol-3-phosphate acyltransferase
MPFPPPPLARAISRVFLTPDEIEWVRGIEYHNAGHGFDPFGMHPTYVALGLAALMPMYRHYFRVKSYGEEKIPRTGPAILAANHSGAVPTDGAMLWADVLLNTRRASRPIADHFVTTLPFVGSLFSRGGVVGGARGNVRALLGNGEMLMIFPEGVPGIGKLFADRYKLQTWRRGHAELAIRHGAPVVPVGLVGPEEQMPQVARFESLGRAVGLPYLPVTLTPLPLPVRYHIHYGDPIPLHKDYKPDDADDPGIVEEAAQRVKDAVQNLLNRGLEAREGIFR